MASDPRLRLEFLPRCNTNGAYHVIQCSIHLDTCWCVDQSGHKIADAVDGRNGKHCGEKPRGKTLSSCGICIPLPFSYCTDHDRPKFGTKIKSTARKLIPGRVKTILWNILPCAYTGENNLETSISPIRPGPHRIKTKLSCYLQINLWRQKYLIQISHPIIAFAH